MNFNRLRTFCGQGQVFDMKYHILHDFRTSTTHREKSSDLFIIKLKLLTNFDFTLTLSPGGVTNNVSDV